VFRHTPDRCSRPRLTHVRADPTHMITEGDHHQNLDCYEYSPRAGAPRPCVVLGPRFRRSLMVEAREPLIDCRGEVGVNDAKVGHLDTEFLAQRPLQPDLFARLRVPTRTRASLDPLSPVQRTAQNCIDIPRLPTACARTGHVVGVPAACDLRSGSAGGEVGIDAPDGLGL
jgi:hypothetical protein